jgi:hypothetical protein
MQKLWQTLEPAITNLKLLPDWTQDSQVNQSNSDNRKWSI